MSSHFKRKHFQNTLNIYLFCVWIPIPSQFSFSTTLRLFEDFFRATANVFLKPPDRYRDQSFLNCKIARKVYKKVYELFENKENFSQILSHSDECFTIRTLTFCKHSACQLEIRSFRIFHILVTLFESSAKTSSFSTSLRSF